MSDRTFIKEGDYIYIAEAPPGKVSTGPSVIFDLWRLGGIPIEEVLAAWKEMGYNIIKAKIESLNW